MITFVTPGPDDESLARFYAELYLGEFQAQREPLEVWQRALRDDAPYRLTVRLALAGETIAGGIAYERYPRSGCGLVTYMVIAPEHRRRGLGKQLLDDAARELYAGGARAVFGEVNDPSVHGASAWPRLARFQRWGARVVDVRYVQPALADGLERDRGLCLIVLPPLPQLTGDTVRAFVGELHAVCEQRAPDAEMLAILDGIPDHVMLREAVFR